MLCCSAPVARLKIKMRLSLVTTAYQSGPWVKAVGDRIGLHPVAVIFAIMAGGQLAGFTGVLLALPVAAVVMVLLRHAHTSYKDSKLYTADNAP